jgi:hypothetical protein
MHSKSQKTRKAKRKNEKMHKLNGDNICVVFDGRGEQRGVSW